MNKLKERQHFWRLATTVDDGKRGTALRIDHIKLQSEQDTCRSSSARTGLIRLTLAKLAGMMRKKRHTASTLAKHFAHDPWTNCLGIACTSAATGVLYVDAILDCLCLLALPTRQVTGIRSRLGRLCLWWRERDEWVRGLCTVNHSLDDRRSGDDENSVRKRVGCDWTRVASVWSSRGVVGGHIGGG